MVKKRVGSSTVTPKKSVTPKIVFKKISSPNKSTKKKQLTPFNKIKESIIKKSNVSKKLDLPSKGTILEDENPGEASKEKKKKTPNKDSKEPKRKLAAQVKVKNLPKNVSKEKKERIAKSVPVPKKPPSKVKGLKPAKSVKKSSKKTSSVPEKSANKMIKKPKPLPTKDTKGSKKGTAKPRITVAKSQISSPGGIKRRKSTADSKAPTNTSPKLYGHATDPRQMDNIEPSGKGGKKRKKSSADLKVSTNTSPELGHVTDPEKMNNISPSEKAQEPEPESKSDFVNVTLSQSNSQESRVSQNESALDSLNMSSPVTYVEELQESVVYGQEGDGEHSLVLNSETGHPDPNGAEESSTTLPSTSNALPMLMDLLMELGDYDSSEEGNSEPEFNSEIDKGENENSEDSDLTRDQEVKEPEEPNSQGKLRGFKTPRSIKIN